LPGSLKRGERGQNLEIFSCKTHKRVLGSLERRKTGKIFLKYTIHMFNLPGKIL